MSVQDAGDRSPVGVSVPRAARRCSPEASARAKRPAAGRQQEAGGLAVAVGERPGLVPSAISPRDLVPDHPPGLGEVWKPAFPDASQAASAARCWPDRVSGPGGPLLVISPGVVAFARIPAESRPPTPMEIVQAPKLRLWSRMCGPRGAITSWSPRSRSRMVRRLAELDWSPFRAEGVIPCMVTLTYPGDWTAVAPEGRFVKAHMAALWERWKRAWPGCHLVWKLEFQERGAPHLHILAASWPSRRATGVDNVNAQFFTQWMKATWADIVNHPDLEERRKHEAAGVRVDWAEGLRCSDPKRAGVYFCKHGQWKTKEYQHEVPEEWRAPGKGPGRFWGVIGLDRVAHEVVLNDAEHLALTRTVRRWHRAQQIRKPKTGHHQRQGRAGRLRYGYGFVCVNDGPAFAAQLARVKPP